MDGRSENFLLKFVISKKSSGIFFLQPLKNGPFELIRSYRNWIPKLIKQLHLFMRLSKIAGSFWSIISSSLSSTCLLSLLFSSSESSSTNCFESVVWVFSASSLWTVTWSSFCWKATLNPLRTYSCRISWHCLPDKHKWKSWVLHQSCFSSSWFLYFWWLPSSCGICIKKRENCSFTTSQRTVSEAHCIS